MVKKIFVLTVILLSGLIVRYYVQNEFDEMKILFQDDLNEEKKQNKLMNIVLRDYVRNNGSFLNPDVKLIDTLLNRTTIGDLVFSGPKLFFYFEETMCSSCVLDQMERLKKMSEELGSNQFVILTSLKNIKKLNHLNRIYQIDIPFYNVEQRLPLRIETRFTPYLFLLDESFFIKMFFIPNIGKSKVSSEYYNVVQDYFINYVL